MSARPAAASTSAIEALTTRAEPPAQARASRARNRGPQVEVLWVRGRQSEDAPGALQFDVVQHWSSVKFWICATAWHAGRLWKQL